MQVILSDHNCEGQEQTIFDILKHDGDWLTLVPMELRWFRDVGIPLKADNETVWRFCQEHGYLLLTGNRTTKDGADSLEMAVRRLITPTSLPIITISNLKRIHADPAYCRRCTEQLVEIVVDLEERYRGVTRLYLS